MAKKKKEEKMKRYKDKEGKERGKEKGYYKRKRGGGE